MMPKSFLFITCVLIILSCSATQKSTVTESNVVPIKPVVEAPVTATMPAIRIPDTIPPQVFMIDTLIKVSHGACVGQCPVYSYTIMNDGSVIWVGQNFVDKTGTYISLLAHEKIEEITQWINKSYQNLRSQYPESYNFVPDFPLTRVYLKNKEVSRSILINNSAPPDMKTILSKIDNWLDQTEWKNISN